MPAGGFCLAWYIYMCVSCLLLLLVSGDKEAPPPPYRLSPSEYIYIFSWGRRQSWVWETSSQIKIRRMDNVQRIDPCITVPSSETLAPYLHKKNGIQTKIKFTLNAWTLCRLIAILNSGETSSRFAFGMFGSQVRTIIWLAAHLFTGDGPYLKTSIRHWWLSTLQKNILPPIFSVKLLWIFLAKSDIHPNKKGQKAVSVLSAKYLP
jgi:hypothetical protein